jgi:hypothetical protein
MDGRDHLPVGVGDRAATDEMPSSNSSSAHV